MNNKAGYIEYKMPVRMAQAYMKLHKGKIPNVNEYLCQIVNEQFGLKGHCVRVIQF